jgi:hypothetical protein
MFVSDRLVFVELQKTGCTHIRNLLKDLIGGQFVERHIQADPRLFVEGRSFLGSIRDPWEWHVSLWAYSCDHQGDFFDNVTTRGIRLRKRGWRLRPWDLLVELLQSRPNWHPEQWRRTFRDINDPGAFREWLYMLHDSHFHADVGEGYWRFPLNRFAGLLTYRYLKLFACRKGELSALRALTTPAQLAAYEAEHCFIDHFIRNERLEPDLLAALDAIGVQVPLHRTSALLSAPRTNISPKRRPTGDYYDFAAEALVGNREKLIIDRFGYVAPSVR